MHHTRINSEWIKGLNVRPKTIKIIKENIGSKILVRYISDICPHSRETQEKDKQLGLHQTKKFLHSKENYQENKKTVHRMGERIC